MSEKRGRLFSQLNLRLGCGLALAVAVAITLTGCETTPPATVQQPQVPPPPQGTAPPVTMAGFQLLPVDYSQLPNWAYDNHAQALKAFRRSCGNIGGKRAVANSGNGGAFGTSGDWRRACSAAASAGSSDAAARDFFEAYFVPYLVESAGSNDGLFTGYYEALLNGSRRRSDRYSVPLYRPPGAGGRKYSRAEIEAGALAGKGLELLWADDPVEVFFLQIQGSGRVRLDDGSIIRIGYAGNNGFSYFPIGRELIRRGEIAPEQMSMQAIRVWLEAHPNQADGLMNMNPSYVFFRILDNDGEGPIGAHGVSLTPGRSLAVDPSFVPYGVPVWLETTDPVQGNAPMHRLVVAQDTGGAIKGPIRGDVFWGMGQEAELRAGLMKQPGRYFLLLPRAAAAVS
jgi:Membrane-bound lytic murein transglycosylase